MTQTENPIDVLERAAELLRLVCGADEEAAFLLDAVQRHVHDGTSLDEALGLRGGSTARTPRFRRLQRDKAMHLREALWHCSGNQAELARQIVRFGKNKWPIYASKTAAADWSPLLRSIDAIYRIGSPPTTAAGIHKLLHRAW